MGAGRDLHGSWRQRREQPRPGYQKLLEDARTGAFEVVVAEALDRLSRDQEHIAAFYKQVGFAGVRLVTLAEGEISELHVGLKGTMNALFLKDLAQKTRRGLEGRVRQGRSGGGLCYGYDVIREVDAAGNPSPAAGGSTKPRRRRATDIPGVCRRPVAAGDRPALNAEYVPGPRGRLWRTPHTAAITRGAGILHNELYIGRLVWNRHRYIKDPATGKRVARVNPEETGSCRDVPNLRIIDDALWMQVQQRLRLRLSKAPAWSRHARAASGNGGARSIC